MKTIAAIEDDSDLLQLLRYNLESKGYKFVATGTGSEAVSLCRQCQPDVVLLDIMLPGMDGLQVFQALKAADSLREVPVIFLTARASETDRVIGLELGANDYIVKPFSVRELLVRIRIQLSARNSRQDVLKAGPIELDRGRCTVFLHGEHVSLSATEFRLLEHLMSSPGQVFSRSRLLDAVWGQQRDVLERTVDAYIVRLRNKLEAEPDNPRFIQSLRGIGYCFCDSNFPGACAENPRGSRLRRPNNLRQPEAGEAGSPRPSTPGKTLRV
jgi:DNA-binding response OmpR family regulator